MFCSDDERVITELKITLAHGHASNEVRLRVPNSTGSILVPVTSTASLILVLVGPF